MKSAEESETDLLRMGFGYLGDHLRGGPGADKVPADTTPVTLAELLQAEEELAVLFLRPRDPLLTGRAGAARRRVVYVGPRGKGRGVAGATLAVK